MKNGIQYMINDEPMSNAEASAFCTNQGGKLIEPKSDQANNDVLSLARLTNRSYSFGVWTGIMVYGQGYGAEVVSKYASDNSSIVYSNWANGTPSKIYDGCGIILASSGIWTDAEDCSHKAISICERNVGK